MIIQYLMVCIDMTCWVLSRKSIDQSKVFHGQDLGKKRKEEQEQAYTFATTTR